MIELYIHPQSWIDWLTIHLSIGGVVILAITINQIRKMPSSFSKNLMRALGYKKTKKEILQDWFVYLLAGNIVVIGWPIFLIWLVYDKWQAAKATEWQNKPNFKAAPQYLTRITTKDEAESENYIHDPLGCTPNLPFGHLNKAWLMFLDEKLDTDELWYFDIPKGSSAGKYGWKTEGQIKGITIVRACAIVDEFFIMTP